MTRHIQFALSGYDTECLHKSRWVSLQLAKSRGTRGGGREKTPGGVHAGTEGSGVTLKWRRHSLNEEGYYERKGSHESRPLTQLHGVTPQLLSHTAPNPP